MLTVKMLRRYRVWANEALQLLQLGDAHRQLEPLSGQEALIKSQAWHVTQSDLGELAKFGPHPSQSTVQNHISIQPPVAVYR